MLLPGHAGGCGWVAGMKTRWKMLAKVVGVSISLNALLALLFFILKIKLNLVGLLVIAWRPGLVLTVLGDHQESGISSLGWIWLVALAGFSGVIAWRLFQARKSAGAGLGGFAAPCVDRAKDHRIWWSAT